MEMSFSPSDKEKSGVNPEKAVGHRHSHSLLAKGWIATFYGKVIGKYLFKMRNAYFFLVFWEYNLQK